MESREKCQQIIDMFNGTKLAGANDPLLVKFADGGSKKKSFKSPDPNARSWRDVTEVSFVVPTGSWNLRFDLTVCLVCSSVLLMQQILQGIPVTYDPALPQNGVSMNVGTPLGVPYTRYGAPQVGSYAMPGAPWVPGYMMASQPMPQVDDQVIHSKFITLLLVCECVEWKLLFFRSIQSSGHVC